MALPPPSPTTTCLVTGASSGIGSDIARELATRGLGVTLVARREDRLRTLADELAATDVRVEVIAADVADPDARARMIETIKGNGLDVEVLINNAGYGSGGSFVELDAASEVAMVRINCEAVVGLCAPGQQDSAGHGFMVPGGVRRPDPAPGSRRSLHVDPR